MAVPSDQLSVQEQVPVEAQVSVSPSRGSAGFFEDDNCSASSLRLMCMVSLISSIIFGVLALYVITDGGNGLYFTLVSLVGAFAPKAIFKAV